MRTGTLRELDVVIGLLRRFELSDGDADILLHDIARRLMDLRPMLRDGRPATSRLECEFADKAAL